MLNNNGSSGKIFAYITFMRIVSESTAKASPLMSWKILRKVPRLSSPPAENNDEGRDPDEETSELQQTDLSALLQTLSRNGKIFIIDIYRIDN